MEMMIRKDYVRHNEEIFRLRDPFSCLSHFAGFLLSIVGMPILLTRAAENSSQRTVMVSLSVYMLTMILLYGASASYHAFNISPRANRILKKIDHMSIFILIAGTYTPICAAVLPEREGNIMLAVIWSIGLLGILFKAFFVYCPKWVSSVIYLTMGWAVVAVMPILLPLLSTGAFLLLLLGGLFYTVGAIIYALKLTVFKNPYFGNHELFHLFVLAGSLCHYLLMLHYIAC